jgi:hypothetical protein
MPDFRDLSLWQVFILMIYYPLPVLRQLLQEISLTPSPRFLDEDGPGRDTRPSTSTKELLPEDLWAEDPPTDKTPPPFWAARSAQRDVPVSTAHPALVLARPSGYVLLGLVLSILLALLGANRLWSAATDIQALLRDDLKGAPFWFLLSLLLYFGLTLWQSRAWWGKLFAPALEVPISDAPLPMIAPPLPLADRLAAFIQANSIALALSPVALILVSLAYSQNVSYDPAGRVNNVILTPNGTIAWLGAIALWAAILGLPLNRLAGGGYALLIGQTRFSLPRPTFRNYRPGWQHLALALIFVLGVYFRFDDFRQVPPEMTSDHIEKLLDSKRVYDGYYGVFFPNNGGREGFHMYVVAALVRFGGLEFSFETLKTASAFEGLAMIALSLWWAQTVLAPKTPQDRRLATYLGLSFAFMVAVSSWHVMLSRLGLRIALTPLTTMLVSIFLLRLMRHNRRGDAVWLGLILGLGFYFYQANRMLPLLVGVGWVLGVLVYARTWREAGAYGLNFLVVVWLAGVVFLPLYRYGQLYPEYFWERTQGRMFGDNAFLRTNPATGAQEAYDPSRWEQADRFLENIEQFQTNYWNAIRMWGWTGDRAWINNGGGRPALDPYTNGLLMLGALAWALLFLRRWEIGHFLVFVGLGIMLLPSALTLAYPIENPSFTRTSGTIPFIFLLAAYPVAQLLLNLEAYFQRKWALAAVGLLLLGPVALQSSRMNYENYFSTYRQNYSLSWKPYSNYAAPMRDFAQGEGSYGNAFMIAYPHWLDHRILGTVAGDIAWNNGLVNRGDIFSVVLRNQGTAYQYKPAQRTFLMYNLADVETTLWLNEVFPPGERRVIEIPGRPDLTFVVYLLPPEIDWAAIARQENP